MRVRGYGTRKCPFEPDSEVEVRRIGKMGGRSDFILSTSIEGGYVGVLEGAKLVAFDFIHGKIRRSAKYPDINGIAGADGEAWYTAAEAPGKIGSIHLTGKRMEVTPCERTLPTTESIWARLGPDRWLAGRMVINRDLEVVCELPEGFFPARKLDYISLDTNGRYLVLTSPQLNWSDTSYDWQVLDLKTGNVVLTLPPSFRELIGVSPPWVYTLVRPDLQGRGAAPDNVVGSGSVVRHNVETGVQETVYEFTGSHESMWGVSEDQLFGRTFPGLHDQTPTIFSMNAHTPGSTVELTFPEWSRQYTSAEDATTGHDLFVSAGRVFSGTSWQTTRGEDTLAFCVNDLATLDPLFHVEIENLTLGHQTLEWLCSWSTGIGVMCYRELIAIELKV